MTGGNYPIAGDDFDTKPRGKRRSVKSTSEGAFCESKECGGCQEGDPPCREYLEWRIKELEAELALQKQAVNEAESPLKKIFDILLPIVGTADSTTVGMVRRVADELIRYKPKWQTGRPPRATMYFVPGQRVLVWLEPIWWDEHSQDVISNLGYSMWAGPIEPPEIVLRREE
jgi:hypothetical protein